MHALVTIPMSTFLGAGQEPGSLAGYGPLPAGIVRELMTNATWQCAIIDDAHGTLLGLGRATHTGSYTPGTPLVDHVTARDLTCRFPGCGRSAHSSEIDHLVPHPRGSTCTCNTGPLCPHHHRLKHEAGWDVERSTHPDHPPGTLIWISPTGEHHTWLAPALTPAHHYALSRTRQLRDAQRAAELAALRQAGSQEPPPF